MSKHTVNRDRGNRDTGNRDKGSTRRMVVIAATAAGVLTVAGVIATQATADDDPARPTPVVARPATEADLRLAAEWADRMESLAPGWSAAAGRPATADDLRLAAEWARRMAILRSTTTTTP
jgi:hypothetical protein